MEINIQTPPITLTLFWLTPIALKLIQPPSIALMLFQTSPRTMTLIQTPQIALTLFQTPPRTDTDSGASSGFDAYSYTSNSSDVSSWDTRSDVWKIYTTV